MPRKSYMIDMSKKSFKELAIPHFKEVFTLIDQVFRQLESSYYLLGASALAIELLGQGIKPIRATKDIDFAVLVANKEEYQ